MVPEFNSLHRCTTYYFDNNSQNIEEEFSLNINIFRPHITETSQRNDILRQLHIHNILNNSNCAIVYFDSNNFNNTRHLFMLVSEFNILFDKIRILVKINKVTHDQIYHSLVAWSTLVVSVIENKEIILKNCSA